MYQASPMTPPHPARVFSETRAIFLQAVNSQQSYRTASGVSSGVFAEGWTPVPPRFWGAAGPGQAEPGITVHHALQVCKNSGPEAEEG